MGEFKALHSLTELARMNAGVQSIDSAILLGESYDTALTTLLESDKTGDWNFGLTASIGISILCP